MGLMEEHAVERATLVQIGGTSLETHAYLRHCLKRYPDRFKGIGLVPDPRRPEDHMDRLAEDGGIVGFRLHEIGGPLDPTAPMDVRTSRPIRSGSTPPSGTTSSGSIPAPPRRT